jgi:hypothetical protein
MEANAYNARKSAAEDLTAAEAMSMEDRTAIRTVREEVGIRIVVFGKVPE